MSSYDDALHAVDGQLGALLPILEELERGTDPDKNFELSRRWIERTTSVLREAVSGGEAERFQKKVRLTGIPASTQANVLRQVAALRDHLIVLREELTRHPEMIDNAHAPMVAPVPLGAITPDSGDKLSVDGPRATGSAEEPRTPLTVEELRRRPLSAGIIWVVVAGIVTIAAAVWGTAWKVRGILVDVERTGGSPGEVRVINEWPVDADVRMDVEHRQRVFGRGDVLGFSLSARTADLLLWECGPDGESCRWSRFEVERGREYKLSRRPDGWGQLTPTALAR